MTKQANIAKFHANGYTVRNTRTQFMIIDSVGECIEIATTDRKLQNAMARIGSYHA